MGKMKDHIINNTQSGSPEELASEGKSITVARRKKVTCTRCSGTGRTSFVHIKGGLCFKCRGSGDEANPTDPSEIK